MTATDDGEQHHALAFEGHRARLLAMAHRMLGSQADAEDVVQETWLRLSRQDAGTIDNVAGWTTTVTGRLCLDVLRARRTRAETPWGERLADLDIVLDDAVTPEAEAELADSIGVALLTVLDALSPGERIAFVLHDLFAVPMDDIGRILGRSSDATKMLASRARSKVRGSDGPAAGARADRAVVEAFLAAARDGDFAALLLVLDPDVRLTVTAAGGTGVVLGATTVATRASLAAQAATAGVPVRVDGRPGVLSRGADGVPQSLLVFTISIDRIVRIDAVTDAQALTMIEQRLWRAHGG